MRVNQFVNGNKIGPFADIREPVSVSFPRVHVANPWQNNKQTNQYDNKFENTESILITVEYKNK
jgi:hypothetical protein